MGKLVLIGGGGHCKSVLDSALAMNIFDEIVITDTESKVGTEVLGCRVVGTDSELPQLIKNGFDNAFIAIGSIKSAALRKHLSAIAENIGFQFPIICDPTASISPFAKIANGTFIGKSVVINTEANIGKHCIINTGSILEHECTIGDYTHISVGAVICGSSHIGYESFIGAGSTVIQGTSIGDKTVVGANSVILSDVEDDREVYGIVTSSGGV